MAVDLKQDLVSEAVRSLEVRWFFPGKLGAGAARWFGRFPARTESREDCYLLDPQLPGLSVKLRAAEALEVKAYSGSPGILEMPDRARGRLESWQKWSFRFSRLSPGSVTRPAGFRYARPGTSAGSHSPGRPLCPARGWASSCGARSTSPSSGRGARTGGPWDSRRPASSICTVVLSRKPPCSYLPKPRQVWKPAWRNPGPMRSGCRRPPLSIADKARMLRNIPWLMT